MPSWHGCCECYALWPVAAAGRWSLLLLLSPLLSAVVRKGVSGRDQSVGVGEKPIPAKARRDAVCCSVRCRQARGVPERSWTGVIFLGIRSSVLQPGGDDIVSYRVGGPGSLFRCTKSGPGSMARPAGKLVVVEPGSSEAGHVSRIPGAAIRDGRSPRAARLFAAPAMVSVGR
jgi:hypothetical protein